MPTADPPDDVLILGAGPAGTVAATLLARRGLRVRLVDKASFPRRKVCGACLSGHAVAELRKAGLADVLKDCGAVPLTRFRLAHRGHAAGVPLASGMVLSRRAFDAELLDRAIAAGVTFEPDSRAEIGSILQAARSVTLSGSRGTRTRSARVVLAATGLAGCAFSGEPQLRATPRPNARIGAGAEFDNLSGFYEPATIYMAADRDGYVGIVCDETGRVNAAAALAPDLVKRCGGLAAAAATLVKRAGFVGEELHSADWVGTPPLTRTPASLAAERLLLIGDAAGYVEPFTGEGMGWAIGSARAVVPLAVEAVAGWSENCCIQWERIHYRTVGRRKRWCRLIALGLRSPWVLRGAVGLLQPCPAVAGPVLRHLASS